MAPYYLTENDLLLKSQLFNLNQQTKKHFEVIIPDPHYKKRGWIRDFADKFNYNVVHFPYVSNLKTPKMFDYSILNDAVLMSSTDKLITFQDWRYVHPNLCDILKLFDSMWFVGFQWQVCDLQDHSKSTLPITVDEVKRMIGVGQYPSIPYEIKKIDSFQNPSWGHYCIDKKLWMQVNGVDEVVTNTKHYADLDLYCRLGELYRRKNWSIIVPMVKNVMVRMSHEKGNCFGGSHKPLDYEVNTNFRNCCLKNTGSMNCAKMFDYTVDQIKSGEWIKLYQVPKTEGNKDPSHVSTDRKTTIGTQCTKCGVIAETPHWYEKSPQERVKSLIGVGHGDIKLGRNLQTISDVIKDKPFEQKIKILRESWYNQDFLK